MPAGRPAAVPLTEAFTVSCNSVFAPVGAKVGAWRLVGTARAFGFDQQPNIPAAKSSTISAPSQLRDDLAVGAAAIGQDRDLATPLQMAGVGATIALDGRRVQPRITTLDPLVSEQVITPKVAHQVRSMMIQVLRPGTGTAAAIPGVQVAGKTGTAELRPNSTNPISKDSDAWFVAFAPAQHPKVAVAVMLVGAGFGRSTAAPIQASPANRPHPRLTRTPTDLYATARRSPPTPDIRHTLSVVGTSPGQRLAAR